MSLMKRFAIAAAALALAAYVLAPSEETAGQGASSAPAAGASAPAPGSHAAAAAPAPAAHRAAPAPSLGDDAPFRSEDFAITSEAPDAPAVELRAATRNGRDLAIELGTREPVAGGARVFATVSVSDALGNTILDCTWRDVELTSDNHALGCELPADVALPLAISGHQRSTPSFVENPTVVAIDRSAH